MHSPLAPVPSAGRSLQPRGSATRGRPRRTAVLAATAAVLALSFATPVAQAAQSRAFVLTGDFMTGSLSVVNLDTRAVSLDVEPVHSDAVARWFQGELYVVNRFGQDNVQVIGGPPGYATVRQFSTGNGSNPQDIAFVSATKAYVSRYASASLLIVNPATGSSSGAIDLSAFADEDGTPEMARMIRVGRWLFVALQRLTPTFVPSGTSMVAVVDTDADTVLDVNPALPGKQAIILAAQNPVTPFAYDAVGRRLLIGCTGDFVVLDGGVEAIDPVTFQSLGLVVTEAALGGDIGDLAWFSGTRSYAIVSDASFNTSLVAWNPSSGTKISTVFSPVGFVLPDCAINDRGELYVCDNDFFAPGLYVFSAATGAMLAGPLGTGLPPQQVVFDEADDAVLAVPGAVVSGISVGPALPNPARSSVRFSLRLAFAGGVRVEVFDPGGRRVRRVFAGPASAGDRDLKWDLRDDAGNRVVPGVYVIRVSTVVGAAATKVAILD